MKKITEYRPQGWIKQAPACRKDYKKKNEAGGRYVPVTYIGAGIRRNQTPKWKRGVESIADLSIKLVPNGNQISLELNDTSETHYRKAA